MDTVIMFTPAQLLQGVLACCGVITAVAAAAAIIFSLIKKAKAPNEQQNKRLEELEKKVKDHDEFFGNDDKRLKNIEAGNRITQKALLALLSHGIDGNDIDSMRQAKEELQHYLIER